MLTIIAVFHIIFIIALIALVLVQDSKGGALGAFGGGGSSSVFGASGGANFLVKATRTVAIFFAMTCLALTYMTSHKKASVLDDYAPSTQQEQQAPAATDQPAENSGANVPETPTESK